MEISCHNLEPNLSVEKKYNLILNFNNSKKNWYIFSCQSTFTLCLTNYPSTTTTNINYESKHMSDYSIKPLFSDHIQMISVG